MNTEQAVARNAQRISELEHQLERIFSRKVNALEARIVGLEAVVDSERLQTIEAKIGELEHVQARVEGSILAIEELEARTDELVRSLESLRGRVSHHQDDAEHVRRGLEDDCRRNQDRVEDLERKLEALDLRTHG